MTITPVLKVALPGKSMVSTNPRDFSLHSSYNSIKIFKKGAGSKTVNASSNVVETINHNAGFWPLILLYAELTPGSGRWYARPFDISVEDTYVSGNLDSTKSFQTTAEFKILNNTASSKTVSYYYFVLGHSGK